MRSVVSVDGVITDADRAVVPVLDRGFLYGDSVYEVFWWHRGVLIQAAEHFARLRASAQRIYMEVPGPDARYADAIRRAVEASGCPPDGDAYVRLVVTRGITSIGLKLDGARNGAVVVVVQDAHRPTPAEWAQGLRVALVDRLRVSADALDPAAKTGNYMNNLLALHEARQRGADDAVLLNDRARGHRGQDRERLPRLPRRPRDAAPRRGDPPRHDAARGSSRCARARGRSRTNATSSRPTSATPTRSSSRRRCAASSRWSRWTTRRWGAACPAP